METERAVHIQLETSVWVGALRRFMKVSLEQELGYGKSWVGGEEGPAFRCDYCLFEDTSP